MVIKEGIKRDLFGRLSVWSKENKEMREVKKATERPKTDRKRKQSIVHY